MSYRETYNFWLEDDYFDQNTKNELLAIRNNEEEIEDRFYRDLEFGTGGLRGVIGAGTNRMNFYTVRKATQGLANYIIKQGSQEKGVAIAYDSRRFSPEFALEAALCLNANGIKAYLFDALRPTPELSFAVRKLGCTAGIVVTASHNPPEYNGYKVYWEDGAQITAPKDVEIVAEVKAITDYHTVKTMSEADAKAQGLLAIIGKEIDDAYMVELKKQIVHPEIIKEVADEIKIVYTPLHGTGLVPVKRVLSELGFKNVYVVPEQELPDPEFTTLAYPNPEDPAAFELAIKLAKEVGADIILATDPDADRVGIAMKCPDGSYELVSGNEVGVLLLDYIAAGRIEKGTMPEKPVAVKSLVSTPLADAVAEHYGVELRNVLTGFKWIGDQIANLEAAGEVDRFIFGFEESYGYLAGPYVRDKDAIIGSMLICEMAAYYRSIGSSLKQRLEEIYAQYGRYLNKIDSFEFPGLSGMDKMSGIMEDLRKNPLEEIAGYKVASVIDYEKTEETGLPKANVLVYKLENNETVIVRPSGTEPKIKIYYTTLGKDLAEAEAEKEKLAEALKPIME